MDKNPIVLKEEDFELNFLAEDDEPVEPANKKKAYRILITDDDREVHAATNLLLRNFHFEGHPLEIHHAYSGAEARVMLRDMPDLALIFLDVVMEENDTGLKIVDYIRQELGNQKIRIILRTGQPGEAPEEKVIEAYDINDYRLKTELTATRLFTSVYEALRSYRDLMAIEAHRQGLEEIVKMSSKLFTLDTVEAFYNTVLNQIIRLESEEASAICFRENGEASGFVFLEKSSHYSVVAATGKYSHMLGKDAQTFEEIHEVVKRAHELEESEANEAIRIGEGFLLYRFSPMAFKTFIYVEGRALTNTLSILKEFLLHYDLALDHFLMQQKLCKINCDVIQSLGYDEALRYVKTHCCNESDPQMARAFEEQFASSR